MIDATKVHLPPGFGITLSLGEDSTNNDTSSTTQGEEKWQSSAQTSFEKAPGKNRDILKEYGVRADTTMYNSVFKLPVYYYTLFLTTVQGTSMPVQNNNFLDLPLLSQATLKHEL